MVATNISTFNKVLMEFISSIEPVNQADLSIFSEVFHLYLKHVIKNEDKPIYSFIKTDLFSNQISPHREKLSNIISYLNNDVNKRIEIIDHFLYNHPKENTDKEVNNIFSTSDLKYKGWFDNNHGYLNK